MITLENMDAKIILLRQHEELSEVDNTDKALIISTSGRYYITCARELVLFFFYILFQMKKRIGKQTIVHNIILFDK